MSFTPPRPFLHHGHLGIDDVVEKGEDTEEWAAELRRAPWWLK